MPSNGRWSSKVYAKSFLPSGSKSANFTDTVSNSPWVSHTLNHRESWLPSSITYPQTIRDVVCAPVTTFKLDRIESLQRAARGQSVQ